MKLCLAVYHLLYIDVVARISLETSSATHVLYSLTELLSYKNGRMCICVYVCMYYMLPTKRCYLQYHIQGDSGGKVNILEVIVSVIVREKKGLCGHMSNSEWLLK